MKRELVLLLIYHSCLDQCFQTQSEWVGMFDNTFLNLFIDDTWPILNSVLEKNSGLLGSTLGYLK